MSGKKKIELTFKNLKEATEDNPEKILIVEVPIDSLSPDEIDDYMETIAHTINGTKGMEEFEILYIPTRENVGIKFKKIENLREK